MSTAALFIYTFLLFNCQFCAMQLKPVDFSLKPHEQLGLALNEVEEANEESFDQKLEKLDTKVHRRFHTQIGFVMERVERLEAIVEKLQRILMLNWHRSPGGLMYNLFRMEKNWNDAKEICQFFGGDLAVVDNESRNNIIKNLIAQNSNHALEFWIGVKTRAEMSNSTSSYSNFSEDSVLGGCTVIDQSGKWKLRTCNQQHNFICQISEF